MLCLLMQFESIYDSKSLHKPLMIIFEAEDVWAECKGQIHQRGAWTGEAEQLHFGYGFGTIWSGAGDWNSSGSENVGGGGRRGNLTEPNSCYEA
jgi:hypothetical protein